MTSMTRRVSVLATLVCLAVPTAAVAGGQPHYKGGKNGRMTGGGKAMGKVAGGADVKVTHGFSLRCETNAKPQRLEVNWSGGNKFHLTELTFSECFQTPLEQGNPEAPFDTYVGKGFGRDGSYAEWTFSDDGEPGRTDGFKITVWAPGVARTATNWVMRTDSDLRLGGNHQAHRATGQLAR